MDQESLRRKNEELTQAYKEKNRKFLQVQELYDKLKRKAMLGQMQDAAEDAVDSTLHGPSAGVPQFEGTSENLTNYEEHGSPYGHHNPIVHDQQRVPAGYQHQPGIQGYGSSWPKTMGAQCKSSQSPYNTQSQVWLANNYITANIPITP